MKNNHLPYKILTILFFFLLTVSIYSQPVTWVKVIGDLTKSMTGESVVQTLDGGYAVLGSKGNITNDQKMLLLKLDYLGNLQWLKYPADTNININPKKLVQTKDSGFVMLGEDFTAHTYFLLKTDMNGNFLWRKNYPDTTVAYPALYGFTKTLDNGFILSGYFISSSPPSQKGYLIKIDSLGNVKWQRGYLDSTINNYSDIIQFPDSNYYVTGYTYNTANNSYNIAKKFSKNSNVEWTKILYLHSYGGFVTKILNDKVAISCSQQNFGYNISLLDTSGSIIWQNSYSFPDFLYTALNAISFGNIVVSGFVDLESTIGINRLTLSGNSNFTKTFLHPGFSLIGVNSTSNTNDYGFILAGTADVLLKSHILIIKTDSLFNSPLITNITKISKSNIGNFELYENYPNPFNSSTSVKFYIPKSGKISFNVYDLIGRKVLDIGCYMCQKGLNSFLFNTNQYTLSSGIYLFVAEYENQIRSNKLVIIK